METTRTDSSHSAQLLQCLILVLTLNISSFWWVKSLHNKTVLSKEKRLILCWFGWGLVQSSMKSYISCPLKASLTTSFKKKAERWVCGKNALGHFPSEWNWTYCEEEKQNNNDRYKLLWYCSLCPFTQPIESNEICDEFPCGLSSVQSLDEIGSLFSLNLI